MVVFVVVDALHCIVFLESISLEIFEERGFNWYFIFPYHKPLVFADRFVEAIPRMLFDLISCESLIRVGLKDFVD